MIKYVLGFLFDEKENNLVLIRKLKPDFLKGMLNGVGGKIESHETPLEAIEREFREETGLNIAWEQWQHKLSLTKDNEYFLYIFKANTPNLIGASTREKEEVGIYALSSVLHPANYLNIVPNLKWIIPMLRDNTLKLPLTIEEK